MRLRLLSEERRRNFSDDDDDDDARENGADENKEHSKQNPDGAIRLIE